MLDKRLADISLASSYKARVFRLIKTADSEGWVLDLVSAACQARPRNVTLQEVAAGIGLGAAPASISGLERFIAESAPFVDAGTWRAQLGELETQVCRVEVPAGPRSIGGTGFLVGPDILLTNFHVVRTLVTIWPIRAECSCASTTKGRGWHGSERGTVFGLSDDWLVAGRPPSAIDDLSTRVINSPPQMSSTSLCCGFGIPRASRPSVAPKPCRTRRDVAGSAELTRKCSMGSVRCLSCSTRRTGHSNWHLVSRLA